MRGLTSVIIVTWNALEYTRQCLTSLEEHTRLPHELILVDNGSTDGTVEFLQDYAAGHVHARHILNETNLGFPKAVNQGLALAGGEYLVLLNNDTVATENWLENLQICADSNGAIGMVGPRSNHVSGPQQLDVRYGTLAEMHRFAREFNSSDSTRWFEVTRLVGFCLLIKREAYQKVGGLDEGFGLGNFEDDDLSLRMQQAGYRLLCAGDTFIHHYGGVTFHTNQVDYAQTMQENRRRFLEKWGQKEGWKEAAKASPNPRTIPAGGFSDPIRIFQERFLKANPWLYPEQTPLLSLCMIVKDEEENLPRCLASVQGVVDEIIVVDTGSSDRTVEIARSYGARVFYHPWSGNFSEARNVSLEKARGRWILFLDADEELVKEDGPKLRALLEGTDKDGFLLRETNYIGEKAGLEAVLHPAFRLFRNHPKHRFRGAVHEQILSAVQEKGGQVGSAPIRLNHYGYLSQPTIDKNKIQRNLEIILRTVEKNPKDSFMRFNLGVEYMRLSDWERALENFKASFMSLRGLDVGYASVLVRNIVLCLHQLRRHEEALQVIDEADPAYPDFTDLEYLRGLILFDMGRYSEAVAAFRRCLEKGESAETHISQQGVGSFKAGYSLGLAYQQLGDKTNAVKALVTS
ncbi:MAG: glycosyltransferase [Firmicutes bacterium]|nr:glycosyltransferase [Bacillota bacterium]